MSTYTPFILSENETRNKTKDTFSMTTIVNVGS